MTIASCGTRERRLRVVLVVALGIALGGCGSQAGGTDAGASAGDGGGGVTDAGITDGGIADAGVGDAGTGDGGAPDAGVVPDPTQLPHATLTTQPDVSAYMALNVPGMAAGDHYQDPETGVTIYKLTDATFPTTGESFGHDYFEGNYEISEPYTGDGRTRAILVYGNGADHYLIDFTPGVGVSNPRPLTGTAVTPNHDLAFTFSDDPATPWYAYVLHGSTLSRIDVRTLQPAPGGGFPVNNVGSSPAWLQQSEDDGEFAWMSAPTGSVFYDYKPATQTLLTHTDANINEPRLDRAGGYVGFSMDQPMNGLAMWDTTQNKITWTTTGDPGFPFAHLADLKDLWIGTSWNESSPVPFMVTTPLPGSQRDTWGPCTGYLAVGNGQWMQPGDPLDAWTVWNDYGSLASPGGPGYLAPGAMVLVTMHGGLAGARLLGHPYSTQHTYWDYAWPKFSADGRYVLFTSDMNGSGRYDLFLAVMPVRPAP